MRLQKYMAHCGVDSRRKCEEYIDSGRVKVNGEVIKTQGYIVESDDRVEFDNKIIKLEKEMVYIALNKPRGVVSTVSDEKDRKTVLDCIGEEKVRLYPVGRLDRDSSGLILLTNDGQITQQLLHPKHEIEKTYLATIEGEISKEDLLPLNNGIELDDGMTSKANFRIIEKRANKTRVECKIHEGRNRQVRRMFEAINHPVLFLERIEFGPIKLGKLGRGEYRHLSNKEIESLRRL